MKNLIFVTIVICGTFYGVRGSDHKETAQQACQLVFAGSSVSRPFPFVPTVVDDKQFKNRRPTVTYTVREDGNVIDVRIVKGTGSSRVDAGLVKSIRSWKYKPQPGCFVTTSMTVTLDVR